MKSPGVADSFPAAVVYRTIDCGRSIFVVGVSSGFEFSTIFSLIVDLWKSESRSARNRWSALLSPELVSAGSVLFGANFDLGGAFVAGAATAPAGFA